MYIPKIKTIIGGKINGILKDPKTGLKFNGKFVQDFLGNFYKGESITPNSEPLEFIPDKPQDTDPGFKSLVIRPSEKDYDRGYMIRYFFKDSRTNKIIEIDRNLFVKYTQEKKLYRKGIKIQWFITGEPEDKIIGKYLYPGIKSKNLDVITKAEKVLTGLGDQLLTNPAQFVRK